MPCLIWSLWLSIAPLSIGNCDQQHATAFTPLLQQAMPQAENSTAADEIATDSVRFVHPIEENVPVSSGFGLRRHPILGRYIAHKGMDLPVPVGSPVMSVADGEVVERGHDRRAGNYLTVRHNDGWYSRYLHLNTVSVRKGDRLSAGETIATSGNTGLSTGPHLHLEIGYKGVALDPAPLLSGSPLLASRSMAAASSVTVSGSPRVVMISQGEGGTRITVRFNSKTRTVAPGSKVFGGYRVVQQHNGKYQVVSAA
ncbi:M23 family metallopeptidase [Enterobacter kobei]|uniref:M23 family metallopeptidase n=1 Tax=Enterobacter kobei TaxID=208224 RepID=UPI003A9854FC